MGIKLPSPAAIIAVAALVVATSGVSYAAGKIDTGDIANQAVTSKKVKDGTIKVKDMNSDAVTRLKGQTGPAGPAGPAGTARAYATVTTGAAYETARTKNFTTISRPATGIYCLNVIDSIDVTTTSVAVSPQWIGSTGDNLSAQWVENDFGCPAGTDVGVRTFTFAAGGNNTLSNNVSFSVVVP
ncbi:hypothetical protein [Nocardioides iriomotensis]|uniref:Collagen-like protein n=1 Tax=Nocardioides iriomotensis TaxID=715784 RepID=A0A4Q5IZQ0_9ACTN|nr:hypothetical protein [Nocardioides iriomotensis]RYU11554.1 hypothetical protein ETU37_13385 [Nocardioides iriomotensis]